MKIVIACAVVAAVLLCHASQAPARGSVCGKEAISPGSQDSVAVTLAFSAPGASSKPAPEHAPFIGHKGSRKVHRADCEWGKKISPGKRIFFNSYAEAKAAGYIPCKTCKPDLSAAAAAAAHQAPQLKDTDICSSSTKTFFHRGSCPWAKKISAEHLILYKTRDEALAAGKSPCQACKP